jgi:hypothetical protein
MIALLLAALFQVSAQSVTKAPPSLETHWTEIPVAFRQSLGRVGLAPEGTPEFGPGDLRLLSTKTFHAYSFEPAPDSADFSRSAYSYVDDFPAGGFTAIRVDEEFDGQNWNQVARNTATYDELQRVVAEVTDVYDADANAFVPETWVDVYYRGESETVLDSAFVYGWNGADWERALALAYVYEPDTERLLEAHTVFSFEGQELTTIDYYFYNEAGQNNRIYSVLSLGFFEIPASERLFEYEDGLLRTETVNAFVDPAEPELTEPTERTLYSYYPGTDRLEIEERFGWDVAAGDWAFTDDVSYTYDTEGRLQVQTSRTVTEMGLARNVETYSYAQNEQYAVVEQYIGQPGELSVTLAFRTYYQYETPSSVGAPPAALPLGCWPNPATDQVFLGLPEVEAVSVFNTQGQALALPFNPADRSLNLSGAPAGLYFIAATTPDGATYVARVVKR